VGVHIIALGLIGRGFRVPRAQCFRRLPAC
jgi:hypothetical protein